MASQKAREELARQSGFEDLSFATRSYRPEYSSSPDLRGTYRPERVIRTSEIESTLRLKLAFTSGGRDRQGRSILTIPAGKTEDLSVDKLGDTLSYLTQSPRDGSQIYMYTVIIDLRGSSWKSVKPLLRTLQETIPDKVHGVYIIKPDAFWEKRRSGTGLKKEQSSVFETTLLSSSSKLHQFAEESQLTQELGGTLPYDHNRWINTRLDIENLSDEAISLSDKFDELEQDLDTHQLGTNITETEELIKQHETKRAVLDNVAHPLIQKGEHLISSIKANEPPIPPNQNFPGSPAALPSQERQQVEGVVTHLKLRCSQLMDMWQKRWKELIQCMDLREFEAGYQKVIDWVLGPGESYLSTSKDIGDSVITCEILRKEHEEFELSAREVINHFAQVRELAKKMLQENHYASKDIKSQKEFLDRSCRSFAMRMNRRRDVILTSLKFHKSAGECSVNLDDLFELLCSDSVLMFDYETAESMLRTLEEKAEAVAVSSEDTLRDGLAAQELMTSQVTNARGDDVTPDYSRGIAHVRLTLDELRERKLRTDELCDVRRIKLQQLLQLKQSERDAEQATAWISQLHDATEHNLGDVGRNAEDVEALQQEHEKLEATARSTYDYGRQFLQASLVLRRTCRYELTPNYQMEEKLNNAWGDFSSAMAERGARLSVALMFHRSAEKLVQEMEKLKTAYMREDLPEDLTAELVEEEIRRHSDTRHAIDKEYAETVAMGKALIDRMQLPPVYGEDGTPNRPPHLLEETLMDLEERKMAWERVWQDRDERLRHWLKLGDYEQQMRELLLWVKDRTHETEENRHVIGENLAEAEALSSELQGLEARIKDKEKEVAELIQIIKSLHVSPTEEEGRRPPYGRMADSLEEAWNDLNVQLEGRRILLDTSVAFHHSVEEFSDKIDVTQDEISRVLLAEDVTSSSSLLHQHQELRKSVLELSMQTLAKGQALLDKLREASTHADINNSHATKAACYSVERILEALHHRRQQLDEQWKERKKVLEQCIKGCKIDEEIRKITKWLNNEAEDYLSYQEYGDSAASTQVLLDEHTKFEDAAREKEEAGQRLARETEKLVNADFAEMQDTQQKITQLQTNLQLFKQRVEDRRKLLLETLAFYKNNRRALNKLDEIGGKITEEKLTVEDQKELYGAINAASAAQLRDGKMLQEKLTDGKHQPVVVRMYEELQEKSTALLVNVEPDPADKEFEDLHGWVKHVGEDFLDHNTVMGDSIKTSQDFLYSHQELDSERQELDGKIAKALDVSNARSKTDIARVQDMQDLWNRFTARLEYRLKLAKMYFDFHRHRQLLFSKLEELSSQLTSDEPKENVDASPAMLARQEQLQDAILSASGQMQKESQALLEELRKEPREEHLDRGAAADCIQKFLATLESRVHKLGQLWTLREEQLHKNRQLSAEFVQFEKDTREVILWIKEQSDAFFPVKVDYSSLPADPRELEEKLRRFKDASRRTDEDVQSHLRAAEELSEAEGSYKAAIRVITDELQIAYQRFKTLLADYEVLLSMSATFYTSVEKVCLLFLPYKL